MVTSSSQHEAEFKVQLSSVQEAAQRQLGVVTTQLDETRSLLEQQEKWAGQERAELEGQVATVTRELETEREEWTQSETQLKAVS